MREYLLKDFSIDQQGIDLSFGENFSIGFSRDRINDSLLEKLCKGCTLLVEGRTGDDTVNLIGMSSCYAVYIQTGEGKFEPLFIADPQMRESRYKSYSAEKTGAHQ